jgi:hypothetical protein
MFGSKPKELATPMIEKDHPEIDTSDMLDAFGSKHYWSPSVVSHFRTF